MFDNICFFSYVGDCDSENIREDEEYQLFKEKYQLPNNEEKYRINGKSLYMLSHPMTEEHQQKLMYLQSFSYMETGCDYFTKRQNYESFLILYTYKGQGTIRYRGKEWTLHEHEGMLIDCREFHEYQTAGASWHQCSLHFFGGMADLLYREMTEEKEPWFRCKNHEVFQKKLEQLLRIQKSAEQNRDFLFHHYLEDLLFYIGNCMEEGGEKGTIPEPIMLLQNYLEHNFTTDISLDEMAAFTGFSKYHLIRQFQKYTHFTPKEYIMQLRLDQACLLLQSTDFPSYKIGEMVGFAGEANFIQSFKKYKGKTPGAYRKEIKE